MAWEERFSPIERVRERESREWWEREKHNYIDRPVRVEEEEDGADDE